MLFSMSNLNNDLSQPEEPLISRYHTTMPLTVRNPLNMEIIVGEVEFFLLKPGEGGERAIFIGTDFNYAYSNDFRKIFLENSIDCDDIKSQVRLADNEIDQVNDGVS